MQIKNRQQFLVIGAVAVLVLFAGDKLLLSPLMNLWDARAKHIKELREQVREGNELVKGEAGIRSRWQQMRTNTLPENTSVAEQTFFKALYGWEQNSGVLINGRSPQWRHDADEYMTYQCRVEASGNLSTLSRFLYQIEKDPMALKLESIELSARDKDGQQLSLGLQLSALVLTPQTR